MIEIFERSSANPILRPIPKNSWESLKVYNPGAIFYEGKYHLFYRAMGKGKDWHSSIGHAISEDGENFKRFSLPVIDKDDSNPLEFRGIEDPRLTKVGKRFFMTYTAYDGKVPRLHIATSKNLKEWKKSSPIFKKFKFTKQGGVFVKWRNGKPIECSTINNSEEDETSKSGAIFPEKIGGKYWMLFNESRIWIASSENGENWNLVKDKPFLGPRKNTKRFDNIFVEMGPPPIKTKKGWLVFYHGINELIQYNLGILLLDLEDPTKIIFRSEEPVFGPKEEYELSGIVDILPGAMDLLEQDKEEKLKELLKEAINEKCMPQVTFTTAAILKDEIIRIYYGAGDQSICTATAPLQKILAIIPN